MGILNDTLHDALRPLPGAGSWLRRSQDPNIEAAPMEIDEPMEDSGAMTIYRLQKDGGGGLPAVPSDPRAGDAGTLARGPLPAPAVQPREHDASPRVESWMSDRPASRAPLDAQDRQDRHVSAASIPSSEYVGSSVISSDSSRVPESLERVSKLVERDESENNARRERDEEHPSGRGTPSGDPNTARAPSRAALSHAEAAGPHAGIETRPAVEPRSGLVAHYAEPSLDGWLVTELAMDAGMALPKDSAPPTVHNPSTERIATAATPVPVIEGRSRQDRTSVTAQPVVAPPGAQASPTAAPAQAETGPRLYIGQIEVVVVAPAKPEEKSTAWREDGFLSRNYLRRL